MRNEDEEEKPRYPIYIETLSLTETIIETLVSNLQSTRIKLSKRERASDFFLLHAVDSANGDVKD